MRSREHGFSTMEVLFAVALIGVCLISLLNIQVLIARGAARLEARMEETRAVRNILAIMREFNPAAEEAGVHTLPGGEQVSWSANRRSIWVQGTSFTRADGNLDIALYATDIDVTDRQGRSVARVQLEQTGWRARY